MNSKVLVDTSVWVHYLRGKNPELLTLMRRLIDTQRVVLCGAVLSELLAGIRAEKDRNILNQTLDALEYIEVTRETWMLAGQIASSLRNRGTVIPLTDLIFAALALENDIEVLTTDAHFKYIPRLKHFDEA